MWLPRSLVDDVHAANIEVFHVCYAATRLWARERAEGEPLVFSGYYWTFGNREAGPFRSKSSAYRDAWYRVVRRRLPPMITARNDTYERQRNSQDNKARKRTTPLPKRVNAATWTETHPA